MLSCYNVDMNHREISKAELQNYFRVLEPNFPEWLNDYIATPAMQKQAKISVSAGRIYSDLSPTIRFYSSLDHSIAVALIIWHFTHDKKQTLAGLFHDIATPAFKHCVDFLNGDYYKQESTESLTAKTIAQSKEITRLLKRDGIKLDDVNDYHKYPIADNDTPKLSADRLEYSLSNSLFMCPQNTLDQVRDAYNDIAIQTNPVGEAELGFRNTNHACNFVKVTSNLSVSYRDDRARYSMQFIADVLKCLNQDNMITIDDLYRLSEEDVIEIVKKSKYGKAFETWANAKEIKTSLAEPRDVYYVHHGAKIRYIDPLVSGERVSKLSSLANDYIKQNLAQDMSSYVYLDGIASNLA